MLPLIDDKGVLMPEPEKILAHWLTKAKNQARVELPAYSQGKGDEDATWESYFELKNAYPQLVGKVL